MIRGSTIRIHTWLKCLAGLALAVCLSTGCGSGSVDGCEEGYTGPNCEECEQGYYRDIHGNCVPEEHECAPHSCSYRGTCDDSSGEVVCTCDTGYTGGHCQHCEAGYTKDNNGNCVKDNGTAECLPGTCSGHGDCSDEGGRVACACHPGYAGERCELCASGYHDDGRGKCLPDQNCNVESCSGHGVCDDGSGEAVCTCQVGYDGERCERCAAGYHDGGGGVCVRDDHCLPNSCNQHGRCDDGSGQVVCACEAEYTGTHCENCAAGYHEIAGGKCEIDQHCQADSCNGHGSCGDGSGLVVCTCQDGYTGNACEGCSAGYHDDGSGACVADESCKPDNCNSHGVCNDTSGEAVCSCYTGYAGKHCENCAAGYHLEGGVCEEDTSCLANSCNNHGTCSNAGGVVRCACDTGYTGDYCDLCYTGYHDDGHGNCIADEHCRPDSCNNHGTCDDGSGMVTCDCDQGYVGAHCDQCAAGYHDDGGACRPDEHCQADSCNGHGTCSDAGGVVRCTCNTGYEGERCERCAAGYHDSGGGTCTADAKCEPDSCNHHGTCDDGGAQVVCTCETGYTGDHCDQCDNGYHDDGSGNCAANVACQADSCSGHGTCDDGSGAIVCTCDSGYTGDGCGTCAAGYHDDGSGSCVADATCESNSCNHHGTCDDSSGAIVCTCDLGYAGTYCDQCDTGYHHDPNGACQPDEHCQADSCNGHGSCDDSSGVAICTCHAGYAGEHCVSCAAGYHDDGAGNCVEDTSCETDSCNGHGSCDDGTGQVVCTCDAGYVGAHCDACDVGYHDDGSGNCAVDEHCQIDSCSGNGTCNDSSGTIKCDCNPGYSGSSCDSCAAGYHHDDGSNACVADESCAPDSCNNHGTCDDGSGMVTCDCDQGYVGAHCDQCAAGYHDDGGGACRPDEHCQADSCNGHGTCSDAGGVVRCTCNTGYEGERCERCAAGYHDSGGGTCTADAKCEPDSCNHHGTCDDGGAQVVCTCETGYTGDHCDQCDNGYHDDGSGNCAANVACQADSCSGHGTCDDGSGAIVCTCDSGYTGDGCGTCAAGYHDDGGGSCVADATCESNSCNHHGTCDDSGGAIVCTCDLGYAGTYCDQCDAGYHHDGNGACQLDEHCQADSCNGHGSCDDSSGVAICTCHAGYAGEHCVNCAAGYHDDGAGNCVEDTSCETDSCNGHGSCDDGTGQVVCTCDAGYVGAHCDACDVGYHDDGSGNCAANVACQADSCSGHGTCEDGSGVIVCTCDDGYTGDHCETCAAGYHDDGGGNCVEDTSCQPDSCNGHGSCDDSSGQVACDCTQGYVGAHCDQCAAGYHDDGGGACLPDRETDCGDNLDNDGDSLYDCDDPDCTPDPACPDCTAMESLACGDQVSGDNIGLANHIEKYSCGPWRESGPEYVYSFQAAQDTAVNMELSGLGSDLDIFVLADECDAQACIAHGDLQASFWAQASKTYYIVVDGFQGCTGSYTLGADCDLSDDEDCTDLIDNNQDGLTDCDDPACIGDPACPSNEICYDGIDNNDDGLTDCDDPECVGDEACPGCTPLGSLDCGAHVNASNIGMQNRISEYSCTIWTENGPEVAYEFTSVQEVPVTVTLSEMSSDMDIFVLQDLCDAGSCLTFGDFDTAFTAYPGVTYYLVVDGFAGIESDFVMDIECGAWEAGNCNDGIDNDFDGETDCMDPDCTGDPACMDCTPAAVVNCGDSLTMSTIGQPSNMDAYTCADWDASGPELALEFNASQDQEVTVAFTEVGVDLDIYVLSTACAPDACIAAGDVDVTFQAVANEKLYFLIEGFEGAQGDFTLEVDCTFEGQECDEGYQDNDGDGVCEPSCEIWPTTCQEHSHCDDSSGTPQCVCDSGYIEDPPGQCEVDPDATGESCDHPTPLDPGKGQVMQIFVDLTAQVNEDQGSCGGDGRDTVFVFTLVNEAYSVFQIENDSAVMYLRKVCDDPTVVDMNGNGSEITCFTASVTSPNFNETLEPGTYYLWVDSTAPFSGVFDLLYKFHFNPCGSDTCPEGLVCQPSGDWTSHECKCPSGTLPDENGQCEDDPCAPNPCTQEHKIKCTPNAAGSPPYTCECIPAYHDDGNGNCVPDGNQADWTVFLFLNADSDLSEAGYRDLAEIIQAEGSSQSVHIVVLFDSIDEHARLFYFPQGADQPELIETWTESNGQDLDMGKHQTVSRFGLWVGANYPADHYLLILWDHGDGWKRAGLHDEKNPPIKGFSQDCNGVIPRGCNDGISISKGEYRAAMEAIHAALGQLDIVYFDACLMGMWEVAEATAPFADYLVASSETVPGTGSPYHLWIPDLTDNPAITAEQLGQKLVDVYYSASSANSTMALTDLGSIGQLRSAMSALADALMNNAERYLDVDTVRQSAQTFYEKTFRDIKDFALKLVSQMASPPADIVAAANTISGLIEPPFVYSKAQDGYPGSYGLAVYFPGCKEDMDLAYQSSGAVWSSQSKWDEFLSDYTLSNCEESGICSPVDQIQCGQPYSDTTAGQPPLISEYSCPSKDASGPEYVLEFKPDKGAIVTVTLSDMSTDLDLYVLEHSCNTRRCIVSGTTTGSTDEATFVADANETFYLMVDGADGSESDFTLNINCIYETCDDEVDNDEDGLTDCQDPDCATHSNCGQEICDDNIDNDGDDMTDCFDTGCAGDTACEKCSSTQEINCGDEVSGSTSGGSSDIDEYPSCSAGFDYTGPEKAYVFHAGSGGHVSARLSDLEEDLDILALETTCSPSTCKEAGDTEAYFGADPGVTYYIVVDGYEGVSGNYTLTIECFQ